MAIPGGVNNSATTTMDSEFFLMRDDRDTDPPGKEKDKLSQGMANKAEKGKKSAPVQAPSYLPPEAEGEIMGLWRDARRHWFAVILIFTITLGGAGGLIYLDYQHTRTKHFVLNQHERCLRSLDRFKVDSPTLNRMGIKNPSPGELDEMQANLALCQAWREEMETVRPAGSWSREMVADYVNKRALTPQKQASAKTSLSGT